MQTNLFKEKKKKCSVCGRKVKLEKDKVYLIRQSEGLFTSKHYDAIDCSHCGCQILLWPRFEKVKEPIGMMSNVIGENNDQ